MKRGEIYRTREKLPERGDKRGFYVIVSRDSVVINDRVSTVVCAPVYGEIDRLSSEVVIGPEDGVPKRSSIRCDFLTLIFKRKLTGFVATLRPAKMAELDRALRYALDLDNTPASEADPFTFDLL